jgi:hypothetical protein
MEVEALTGGRVRARRSSGDAWGPSNDENAVTSVDLDAPSPCMNPG